VVTCVLMMSLVGIHTSLAFSRSSDLVNSAALVALGAGALIPCIGQLAALVLFDLGSVYAVQVKGEPSLIAAAIEGR